jgi:hypothetical protein
MKTPKADPSKREVKFAFEGESQTYTLTYDINKICDAERGSGLNLLRPLVVPGMTMSEARALLYASLKAAHPNILLAEAGELLDRDMPYVMKQLLKLLDGETPGGPEGAAEKDNKSLAEQENASAETQV